jgi:hypothetical protein
LGLLGRFDVVDLWRFDPSRSRPVDWLYGDGPFRSVAQLPRMAPPLWLQHGDKMDLNFPLRQGWGLHRQA